MKGETKRYYWLKLKNDFFTNKKIKKLRKIAGGDTYTIIYLKMQLLSITNEGKIYYENVEETFADELALELDEDVENVQVTLMYLIENGLLVEVNSEEYLLPEAQESIGSETSKAELMRKKRAKDKVIGNIVTELLPEVTKSYTEKEIEKEIDEDIELKKDKDTRTKVPYEKIKDLFHEICVSLPKVTKLNDSRKKAIKTRYLEYNSDIEIFRELFTKAERSNFLKGNNDNNWSATFDWLLKPQNMIKVLEGNYENKKQIFTKKPVREEIVPEWFNKKIEKEEMKDEELEAIMKELQSFG